MAAALEMAYVWLADRREGVKHLAGFFYPHSSSTRGLRRVERHEPSATSVADARVLAIIRKIAGIDTIRAVHDLKAQLRSLVA